MLLLPAAASGAQAARATSPEARAVTLLNAIVHGRYAAVVATFNPVMRTRLSAAKLAHDWALYQTVFGRYKGHGIPTTTVIGPLTVVQVPLRMASRPGEFRITFQTDGKTAGLYFLRAGVPL
jgi:hypothetical protein